MTSQKKSTLLDMGLALTMVLGLLTVMYVIPKNAINVWNMLLFALILIPTLKALIHGAPFVPTPMAAVEKIVKAANIQPEEKVYDIGCGDGRMVYIAAKNYQAKATGFELSPIVYFIAKIRQLLWRSKAKILLRDFTLHNLTDANVIVCYLLPETLARLQKKLDRELKKGARIVSYAFPIGTWKEKTRLPGDPKNNVAPIWVYEK